MAEPLRVLVVGGSLGGLTTALLLHDLGHDVHVFERSPAALDSRGAGIVLHPRSERYLVAEKGIPVEGFATRASVLRYVDGEGATVHESPAGYRFTAWNTLYRALLACFPTERYHLGETMTGLEGATAEFASGRVESGDLLVCADGLRSLARERLLPNVHRRYAGYLGWRGVLLESDLSAAAQADLGDAIVYHLMPGSHILTYPIPGPDGPGAPGGRLINFVWYRNVDARRLPELLTDCLGEERELSVPPGLVQPAFRAELREAAERLPPAIRELVQRAPEPFIQEIVDVEVPQMVFGRVCLVGDAAFVARPHAAAGTAKAAADGWALRGSLLSHGDTDSALAAWQAGQLELGRRLLARVREMGERSQFGAGWVAGDPSLRFGLERPGDSEEEVESMPAAGLNHVSLVAHDLGQSVAFYRDLLGLRPIATPNFGFPVQWLAAGALQLHLFERPDRPPRYHHVAFTIGEADFPALYARVRAQGITDGASFGHHLYELPGDTSQLYLRDPSGNLLELDAPGASRLPEDIRREIRPLPHPQGDENRRASLFLERT